MADERPGGSAGSEQRIPALAASRSFVVQLTDDTVPSCGSVRGRVEHIESGRSRRFASLAELVSFFAAVLETAGGDQPL